jgi:hypothetical protein
MIISFQIEIKIIQRKINPTDSLNQRISESIEEGKKNK